MTGGTPSKSKPEYFGGKIRWLVSGDIHRGEINDCDGRITEAGMKRSNTKFLPRNSVMMALNGQGRTRGTVAILRIDATCNQSLVAISPNYATELLPEFLYLNLHGRYEELRRMTGDSGNERRGLNMGLIREIRVPVPPIAEQKRIVRILHGAFTPIAIAKANTEKNLVNARALFESHLQGIFAQRGDGWEEHQLGDICDFVRGPFGGSLKKQVFVSNGYAVYEQQHAIYGDFSDIRYFVDDAKFRGMQRFELRPHDLIMSCSGTMGRVAVVPEGIKRGIINQALLKLTPGKRVSSTFLKRWMDSRAFQEALRQYSGGAAIQNVASVKVLKAIRLLLPSREQQAEIVAELQAFSEETQRLEFLAKQKLAAFDALKKSLLHQAFTGDLTNELHRVATA